MRSEKLFLFLLIIFFLFILNIAFCNDIKDKNKMNNEYSNSVTQKENKKQDDNSSSENKTVNPEIIIEGRIVAVGDANHNELILITENNEKFTFRPEYKDQYWKLQGENVKVLGKVERLSFSDEKTGRVYKKNWLYPKKIIEQSK